MKGIRKRSLVIIELEKRQMLDAALGALATTVVLGEQLVNTTPQILDADVTVTGTTIDFTGLDLSITTDGGANNQLGITNEGSGAGQIGISGSNITYSGIVVGTLNSNGQNGAALTIELNGNANMAAIENLIEAVNYSNTSNNPALSRTINFALEGLFSENMTLSIAPFNDAPVIDTNAGLTANEGGTQTITSAMLDIRDDDTVGSSVNITITTSVTNGRLELSTNAGVAINSFTLADLDNGHVRYVHNGSETLSDSLSFTVSDGDNTLAAAPFSITVIPVDDAPVLSVNDGADVFQGFTTDIGGSEIPTQFGTEILRRDTAGTFGSFHGLINGTVNTQISLIFTTPANLINSNPGQTLFETGSSSSGLGLYLNNQNQLALFAGTATAIPRLTSSLTLETSTQYAVVIEIDTTSDQIRMHYAQAGNFNWFDFGRAAEDQINNWTTTTISANNGAGYGVINSSRGGFNGTTVGQSNFSGTLDSPLILTRFPATATTFTNTNLVFTDSDTAPTSIIYTITDNVDYGTLYRNGVAIGLGDTFTQADLNSALIKYAHNNAVTPDDSFTFSVSDGTTNVAGNTYVIDVNTANNAPDIPDQSLNVSENATNGTVVGTLIATDPDSSGGQTLSYSIQGGTGSGIFSVNAATGVVSVLDSSTLDYETTTSYTLLMRVTDDGPGSLFFERLITVNVQDVNENTAPVIAAGGPFSIDENVGNNTNVGTVSATDLQGDNITYSIVSGNTNTAFKINAATGLIQVNGTNKIDHEALSTYTLRIRATDNNALPLFSERNFVININDLNEGPSLQIAQVINTLDVNVKYNASNGNFYKMINTGVSFNAAMTNASNALLNGANGHLLTITSSAENTFVDNNVLTNHVWLAASDAETEGVWKWLAGPEAGSIFSIGPNATAGFYENWNGTEPNSGTANNYGFLNTNGTWYDHDLATNRGYVIEWESYDVINNRNYVIDYSAPNGSDIANGTIVGRVQGGDQDDGDTLTYSITGGNADGIFEIDSATGQLIIVDNISLDTALQNVYTLTIRVQDSAGLFDTANMDVTFNQLTSVGTNETLDAIEGISTTVTTADLNILDSDTPAADLIISITDQPNHGFIALSTSPTIAITNFTQADIATNRVIYVHNGTENFTDGFEFSVTDGSSTISGQNFNIDVTPVNDSPVININTGTTVLEGGSVILTNTMLSALDADDSPADLTYTVNSLTRGSIEVNGVIQNSFTQSQLNAGLVRFIHNGDEGNGAFNVTVADGGEDGAATSTINFTLTTTPVNDAPTIVNNTGATVVEGGTRTITNAMLSSTDSDDVVSTLIYTLSGIQNGTVQLSTSPGVPVISFTQDDINNNRVQFIHDGNEANARFNFSVADGGEDGALPATGTFTLTKTPLNDAPTIGINTGASVNQNSIVIIKNSVLAGSDPDDSGAGLTYTVTGTNNGQLERISNQNVAITSFTQEDIDTSQIIFRHSGPVGPASFNFTLADGGEDGAGTASGVFNFTVDNTNDSPIVATNIAPTINNGASLTLSTAMLDSFDPDDLGDGLVWSITNLQSGSLLVNGLASTTFTQTQLDSGLVSFTHDGSATLTAGFTATIADGGEDGATTDAAFFKLNINASNTLPQIDNNDLITLNEGDTATITTGDLSVSDADNVVWYNGSWQYRQGITIDHNLVSQDLTDYVLLIDGSNFTSDFWSNVKNDGSDIVITLGDGTTKLSRELVTINRVAGTMELHVKIPALSSSTDTQLYIYYGNLAASETNSAADTYTHYNHVYHMNDANAIDVRGGLNGFNASGGTVVSGVMGNGIDFSGTGMIDIPTINGAGIRTVSFWYNPDTDGGGDFGTILGSIVYNDGIRHTGTDEINLRRNTGNIVSSSPIFNTDKHLIFAYDSTAGTITLYENGIVQDTDSFVGWYNFEFLVGIAGDASRAIDGTIDEIRLSSNTLSAGWAATEYANQSDPSSFIKLTGQQAYQSQSLSYSVSTLPANGTLFLDANNNGVVDGGEVLSVSSTFTQSDITNNHIKYLHNGGETISDSFQFTVTDGTDSTAAQTFNFAITPVNDAPILSANTGLTMNEGATSVITNTQLSYSDSDDAPADLSYTASNLSNGIITVNGVTQNTFTQADINAGIVRFIHNGSETLSAGFDFALTDGDASITAQSFAITITPVNDAPILSANTGLTMNEGATTIITNTQLSYSDVDDIPADLAYTASNLSNGILTVNAVTQNTFTQADINAGLVRFIHDGSETLTAGFDFFLTDGDASVTAQSFAITITPVNDAPIISANTGLTMNEGATNIITNAQLSYSDVDDIPADLVYTASNLSNGLISVNGVTQNTFTQADINADLVEFIHDGTETLSAGFDFAFTDGDASITTQSFAITITPVNDSPSIVTNTGATLNEGSFVVITTAMLNEGDPDDSGVGLTYTATSLINGSITVGGVTQNTFTQADIDAGIVRFNHDGSEAPAASFAFSLADGGEDGATPATGTFNLNVTPINDSPVIATNTGATMDEGASLVITTAMLNEGDPDDSGSGLTYTASGLVNGIITVNGVTQNTFTQADIDAGLVVFVHNGGENLLAGFDISLADGGENGATPDTATFAITVTPVNDAPVINGWNLVSNENFEAGATGWANNTTTVGGTLLTRYLGPFSNDGGVQSNSKTYTLTGGQDYTVIEFDFYRMDSWDSEEFRIFVNDTRVFAQAFSTSATTIPDGSFGSVSWTVSELTQITGNLIGANSSWTDQVFRFTMTVQNDSAGTVKLGFGSTTNQATSDESWGIDNVKVYEASAGGTPGPFTLAENTANGQVVGTITAGDVEGDAITYSIIGGTGLGTFAINSATGAITVTNSAALNYEVTTSFTLQVRATDNGSPNLFDTKTITINLIDVPENTAPVITTTGPFNVAENAANNTVVGNMAATDAEGNALTWSITAGNTDNIFSITAGGQIRVNSNTNLNFEWDNQYVLTIQALDNGFGALASTRNITINITNINEAPTFDTHTALLAGDPYLRYNATTGNYYKYISTATNYAAAGANAAAQTLHGVGGHIATITSAAENTYVRSLAGTASIWLAARDSAVEGVWRWEAGGSENGVQFWQGGGSGAGGSVQNGLYANWNGVNEPNNGGGVEDNAIMINTGLWNDVNGGNYAYVIEWEGAAVQMALAALQNGPYTVAENSANGTSVGFLEARDPDAGDTLTYSITGGTGNGIFAVNGSTGELTVANSSALNFEGTNSYTLNVRVQDAAGLFSTRTVTINLSDVNEAPTLAAAGPFAFNENITSGTTVLTMAGADVDGGQTLSYSIQSGNTGGMFAIDAGTGAITFAGSPDFETLSTYNLVVRVTDNGAGNLFAERTVTININDLNEAPTLAAAGPFAFNENIASGTSVVTMAGADVDGGQTLSYSIQSGNTGAMFAIDVGTGAITFAGSPDFETLSTYNLVVRVTENGAGNLFAERTVTININDLNEAPTALNISGTSIDENSAHGTVIGTLSSVDQDLPGDTFTYTIQNDPDNKFIMVGNELRVNGALDYETVTSHSVTIRTNDGAGGTFDQIFNISVNDINDAPTALDLSTNSVSETAAIGTVIGTFSALDADLPGDTFSYTIINDPDNKFIIVGNELRLNAALNYAVSPQHNVEIEVSDNNGGTFTRILTIDVLDNVAPTDIMLDENTIAENSIAGTLVGLLSAVDVDDPESFTYSLANNPGNYFEIQGNELRVLGAIDFELTPVIELTIRVIDSAGNVFDKLMSIQVNDVAEFSGDIVTLTPAPDPQTGLSGGEPFTQVGFNFMSKRDIFSVNDILKPFDFKAGGAYITATLDSLNGFIYSFYGQGNQILRDNTFGFLSSGSSTQAGFFTPLILDQIPPPYETGNTQEQDQSGAPPKMQDQTETLRDILLKLQNEDLAANENGIIAIHAQTLQNDFQNVLTYQEQKLAALRQALMNI